MTAIELKPKALKNETPYLIVFDELIQGLLHGTLLVPAFVQDFNGYRLVELDYLIDNYKFPVWSPVPVQMLHFLKGHSPKRFEEVEFFESESIEIDESK